MSKFVEKILREAKFISLKENKEVIPSILYHFTSPSGYANILKTNILKKGRNGFVSFSEDPELWTFRGPHGDEQDEIGVKLSFHNKSIKHPIEYYISQESPFDEPLEHEKEWRTKYSVDNIKEILVNVEIMEWAVDFLKRKSPETLSEYNYKIVR